MQAHDATPIVYRGFKRGFKGVSFLLQLCVCIKSLQLGKKTLPTLIQTNETYESTQIDAFLSRNLKIDAFFEPKPKIDAFLKIDANGQRKEYKKAS